MLTAFHSHFNFYTVFNLMCDLAGVMVITVDYSLRSWVKINSLTESREEACV